MECVECMECVNTLYRAIRHFHSSRSNEVADGRLELPIYGFARQCSNQLSYSDTWLVQVFEFLFDLEESKCLIVLWRVMD